jgi:adenine deaminase
MIAVARGHRPADLVIDGARVVNVFSGEIETAQIAIAAGHIAGLGCYHGRRRIDARGLYAAPGFIDAHIHLESSMLTPREFARAVVPLGTTTVIADPHEIANVLGSRGIRYMLQASDNLPLDIRFMLPSCVPATALETAGAHLGAEDLQELFPHPRVLGLAEVMNYAALLRGEREVLDKLCTAPEGLIDGHAPTLVGKDLNAYVAAGAKSDHECLTVDEARAKLRAGMYILIREGSVAHNLRTLAPLVTPATAARCGLVSDDRRASDLLRQGHVNYLLEQAVAAGIPASTAIRMVTINPASHYRLRNIGAVAPGYRADVVLLEDLKHFRAHAVLQGGKKVAREGRLTAHLPPTPAPPRHALHIAWTKMPALQVAAEPAPVRVISVSPNGLLTEKKSMRLPVHDGRTVPDTKRGINKIAVVERHHGTGNVGVGFVEGMGLQRGAIASTVAHDSHNVVSVGTNDADILGAVRELERIQGGLAVSGNGRILASLPLPIAGLMSEARIETVAAACDRLTRTAHELGSRLPDPFMALSFLALPVIPSLRLTDRGLVDVDRSRLVPLFGED